MTSPAERLKAARTDAGFSTAVDGAARVGVSYFTYAQHENGTRAYGKDAAQKYGRAFKVPASWLLMGEGLQRTATIPIVGYVGADAEFFGVDDHMLGAGLDAIETPPGAPSNAVAVIVRGNSMHPAIRDGEVLVYWDIRTDPEPLIGIDCFLKTRDGHTVVKTLERGSAPGLWTLASVNSAVPPMRDCELEWAAPIEVKLRRANWRG